MSKPDEELTFEDWQATVNERDMRAQVTVAHLLSGSDRLAKESAQKWSDLDNEAKRIAAILYPENE